MSGSVSRRVAAVLSAHAGSDTTAAAELAPGARVAVRVDEVLLDGPTAALVLKAHAAMGRRAPAAAAARFAFVAGTEQSFDERGKVTTFAREHAMPLSLDPARAGLPATVAVDEGLVDFDHLVAGASPDVAGLGGLGCVVLRCSPTELAGCLCGELVETVVPETRVLRVEGRLHRWIGPVDLAMAAWETVQGAPQAGAGPNTGLVLELRGGTITEMPVADRLSLCATLASAGIAAVCPPDASTEAWIAARRPGNRSTVAEIQDEPPPDSDSELSLNGRKVALTAVQLPWPGTVSDPTAGGGPRVEHVVVGGRIEDLRVAAEVLRDRQVRPGLLLEIRPASSRALLHAIEEGLAADLLRAGACLRPPGPIPAAATGERRVVSVPTGNADVLVNPGVAAATAVTGGLIDPEGMRRAQRRVSRRR